MKLIILIHFNLITLQLKTGVWRSGVAQKHEASERSVKYDLLRQACHQNVTLKKKNFCDMIHGHIMR